MFFPDNAAVLSRHRQLHGSKSEWLVLANGYVDLGTWWCVTPFVGAGVGVSRITIANFTDTVSLTPAAASLRASSSSPTGSKWNFAWALHAGLAYKVNPSLTVELGYSYREFWQRHDRRWSRLRRHSDGHVHDQFKNITSHDLKLGVRWNLDSPPVYAPPLVRKG